MSPSHELKPELTFRQGLRALVRWSLVIILAGIISSVLARVLITSDPSFTATVPIHAVDTTLTFSSFGEPVPMTVVNRETPDSSVFITLGPARQAAAKIGAPSAGAVMDKLAMTAVGPFDVDLSYTAPTAKAAEAGLAAYLDAYLEARRAPQRAQLQHGYEIANTGAVRARLRAAIDALDTQIGRNGPVETKHEAASVSPAVTAAGGYAAGLVLASLIVLLFVRNSDRIRLPGDVRAAGLHVTEIASVDDEASLDDLRVELELAGIGRDTSVVAVCPLDTRVASRPLALALARRFAASSTHAVVVEAASSDAEGRDPRGSSAGRNRSSSSAKNVTVIEAALKGDTGSPLPPTKADALVESARGLGDVVVVDTSTLVGDAAAIGLAQAADTVLIVLENGSRWSTLESVIDRLSFSGRSGRIMVCYDWARPQADQAGEERSARRAAPPVAARSDAGAVDLQRPS
jgi:hypothetical protein